MLTKLETRAPGVAPQDTLGILAVSSCGAPRADGVRGAPHASPGPTPPSRAPAGRAESCSTASRPSRTAASSRAASTTAGGTLGPAAGTSRRRDHAPSGRPVHPRRSRHLPSVRACSRGAAAARGVRGSRSALALALVELRHPCTGVRDERDHAVGCQDAQGLAYRKTARAEALGDVLLTGTSSTGGSQRSSPAGRSSAGTSAPM